MYAVGQAFWKTVFESLIKVLKVEELHDGFVVLDLVPNLTQGYVQRLRSQSASERCITF